jgi:hypothetical protein
MSIKIVTAAALPPALMKVAQGLKASKVRFQSYLVNTSYVIWVPVQRTAYLGPIAAKLTGDSLAVILQAQNIKY